MERIARFAETSRIASSMMPEELGTAITMRNVTRTRVRDPSGRSPFLRRDAGFQLSAGCLRAVEGIFLTEIPC